MANHSGVSAQQSVLGSHPEEGRLLFNDLFLAVGVTCHLLPFAGVVISDRGPQLG